MLSTFGTDGIRGIANEQLGPEVALALGRACARHLGESAFLVGRDTRQSGPMLLGALSAGITSEGLNVIDVGVIPTPGLAWLATKRNLPAAMISASHNPFGDNGIKLFAARGTKLSPEIEGAIERDLNALLRGDASPPRPVPVGSEVGTVIRDRTAVDQYVDYLVSLVTLDGPRKLSVVCDCANGAASALASEVFARLKVDVKLIACTPDGTNINDNCGATSPAMLAQAVVREHADLGLSFDGDADRLIAVDSEGNVVDGDVLLALFAFDLDDRGELADRSVVVTVMSNLGLRRALNERGIAVIETAVGDRNVTDAMELHGLALGGEQSGHIVFRRDALIGDGLLTGLKLLELVARSNESLHSLTSSAMTRLPQILCNVAVSFPERLQDTPAVFAAAESLEATLGKWGRVFIRASGTEPKVRVMVEAEDRDQARAVADELVELVERELGAPA